MTIEQWRVKASEELNRTVEGLKAMLAQVEAPSAPTKHKPKNKFKKELSKARLLAKF